MSTPKLRSSILRPVAAALFAAASIAACTTGGDPAPVQATSRVASAVFSNGGFEMGIQGWSVGMDLNANGVDGATPETLAGLQLATGGNNLTTVITQTNQPDPDLGATASLRLCRYGTQCARVNYHSSSTYANGRNVNVLSQQMPIQAGDVDPADGQVHVRFTIAPVLQNPGHPVDEQPYFFVQLTNVTQGNSILYRDFNLSAQPGVPWKTVHGGTANEIDYVDWTLVDISPGAPALNMGDTVELQIIASGCQPGGHFGEIYVDGSPTGAVIPGLFLTGTGPAQANPGNNLTYNITYRNGSPPVSCSTTPPVVACAGGGACVGGVCAETGVVISFTTPPGTTFQGFTPPPGATCSVPAVGMAGTIVCTFTGPVPSGAIGSMTVTVNITSPGAACTTTVNCATGTPTCAAGALSCVSGVPTCSGGSNVVCATGTAACSNGTPICTIGLTCDGGMCLYPEIVAGTYSISSTQETPLLGNKVTTFDGCTVDAECPTGDWCDESVDKCKPTLPNGTPIPSDPGHSPLLNGMCTAAAGALVCTSGVCDTTNNECGYANSDGPCTPPSEAGAGNGSVVCDSLICDTDGKCGFASGDGPCIPGAAGNGALVCRSGTCSDTGVCLAPGTCDDDADCAGTPGDWCKISTHTCTPKLPNGTPIPNDPNHVNPPLQGTCTTAAAMLVCASGVCDIGNNECGYANGNGPCTPVTEGGAGNGSVVCQSGVCDPDMNCGYTNGDGPCLPSSDGGAGNGAVVCRSMMCSDNGTCEPPGGCNEDADCGAGKWCDISINTCKPTLPNGSPMPSDPGHGMNPQLNGMCNPAAATLVCQSGVCDAKNSECGYANGDGPCTPPSDAGAGTGELVCQSAVCDPDMKCGYANGDGPCVPPNVDGAPGDGTIVCRSQMCSDNGTCEPSGGCNEDADCASGMWCDISINTCKPRLPNGSPIPSDPGHGMNPQLNGMCNAGAGALVCVSGVCDTKDNECGYANGDGPCSEADGGAVVCRSGMCSVNGTCEPSMGCNTNSDCTNPAMPICDPSTHTCVPAPDAGSDAGMDAGPPPVQDSGVAEAGPMDSGAPADATTEAGPAVDAAADAPAEMDAAADAGDSGYLQGGGCAIAPAHAGEERSAMAGWLVAMGLALGARRRTRRKS